MAAVAWFFWGSRGEGGRAAMTSNGRQEIMILVKGGYTPDVIELRARTPARLVFRREESSSCTEMVVFPDFDRAAQLPEGRTVPVDLDPAEPGEYQFACQTGMVRGRLVVS
jgi:plastocyanin domain-containing protein